MCCGGPAWTHSALLPPPALSFGPPAPSTASLPRHPGTPRLPPSAPSLGGSLPGPLAPGPRLSLQAPPTPSPGLLLRRPPQTLPLLHPPGPCPPCPPSAPLPPQGPAPSLGSLPRLSPYVPSPLPSPAPSPDSPYVSPPAPPGVPRIPLPPPGPGSLGPCSVGAPRSKHDPCGSGRRASQQARESRSTEEADNY